MSKSITAVMVGSEVNGNLTALVSSDIARIWKELLWEGTSAAEEALSDVLKVNMMIKEFGTEAILRAY